MLSRLPLKSLLQCGLLLGALASGSAAAAAHVEVMLIVEDRQPVHDELVATVRATLEQRGIAHVALTVSRAAEFDSRAPGRRPDVVVTVGTAAAEKISRRALSVPVLNVLIPRLSYEDLPLRPGGGESSAIFLDQPWERRFDLIRHVLPRARRVGAVLGPDTAIYERELDTVAQTRKFDMHVGRVTTEGNLVAVLDGVLAHSDVMLGILDPLIFNRHTTHNVLLTAYRRRVPIMGISPRHVTAGALAAVYSTPAQIGRQLAELIMQLDGTALKLPPPQYPKYFSVAVNYHVAESLGLHIDDEEILERQLSRPRQVNP